MNIPSSLISGDTWSWTDSFADYPAPTWTLTYYFRGPVAFSIAAAADGADHAVSVNAETTGGYTSGVYSWIARVTDETEVKTLGSGQFTINPNLAGAGEYRSFWRRVLDELEPVILGRASTDQLSMSIAGRSLQRMSWDELMSIYDRARYMVTSEDGQNPGRTFIRFERP